MKLQLLLIALLLTMHSVHSQDPKWCSKAESVQGDEAKANCKETACSRCSQCGGGGISKGWISATDIAKTRKEKPDDMEKLFCTSGLAWILPVVFGVLLILGAGIVYYVWKKNSKSK